MKHMAVAGIADSTNTYAANSSRAQVSASSRMSDTAKNYLNELQQKYSGVNIMVADFKSERQSDAYMFGSSGNNNVAISSEIIEKMAANPDVAAKYEKIIKEVPENAKNIEKFAKDNNQVIYGSGVVIDKDGKVSYWMVGGDKESRENPGTVYKEKMQEQLDAVRAKKKSEEMIKEKKLVKAESTEKLLEKINENLKRNVSSDELPNNFEKYKQEKGNAIDVSI